MIIVNKEHRENSSLFTARHLEPVFKAAEEQTQWGMGFRKFRSELQIPFICVNDWDAG